MINGPDSVNSILIPYNCIVDEDTGLLSVIRDKYSNDTVFYMDRIQTDRDIENLVLYGKYNNPLELILKPDYIDKAEDFYNQFMTEEYENILTRSFITKIYDFYLSMSYAKVGRITLLASNEKQKESLEYLFGKDINVLVKSISEVNVDDIDIIFIRRVTEIENFDNIKGKNLYILDYNFNFENKRTANNPLPLIKFSVLATQSHNVIYLISPYAHKEEEEKENDDF